MHRKEKQLDCSKIGSTIDGCLNLVKEALAVTKFMQDHHAEFGDLSGEENRADFAYQAVSYVDALLFDTQDFLCSVHDEIMGIEPGESLRRATGLSGVKAHQEGKDLGTNLGEQGRPLGHPRLNNKPRRFWAVAGRKSHLLRA